MIGQRRYNIRVWKQFCDVFNCMPVIAIIDEKIICMHGGLSPDLHSLDQIHNVKRPTEVPDTGIYFLNYLNFFQAFFVIFFGLTLTMTSQGGRTVLEEFLMCSERMP